MQYDLVISGGTVVDGSGQRPFAADVAVKDGRIVRVAPEIDPGEASTVIDATGRIVAPGFIDNHTHYDAQIMWDPTLDLSIKHGYTTVLAGNCGMSMAPVSEESAQYMLRLLAKVEGIPIDTLEAGVKIEWSSFAEMLRWLDGRVAVNVGFLVGHSALRSLVMGERCVSDEATTEEIAEMGRLLRRSIEEGGVGFSTSQAETHTDLDARPIASRAAAREEFLALVKIAGEYEGTRLEYVPTIKAFSDATRAWLAEMSVTAGRQIDFPLLTDYSMDDRTVEGLLASADVARARGGEVVPQVAAQASQQYFNLRSGFGYEAFEEPWGSLYRDLTHEERVAAFQDDEMLDKLENAAAEVAVSASGLNLLARFETAVVGGVTCQENEKHLGRTFGDVGKELGCSAFRALAQLAVRDDLRTVISIPPPPGTDDRGGWERRVRILRDNRGIVSASDAGAHLDILDQYAQSSRLIQRAVTQFGLMPIEEAVHHLTGMQAEFLGIRDRGFVREGAFADLVVFDLDTMGTGFPELRNDLPAGGARIYTENTGIDYVIVNGTPVLDHGNYTGSMSGSVLRSGKDTYTVKIPRFPATVG